MRDAWEEEQHRKAREELRLQDEERRKKEQARKRSGKKKDNDDDDSDGGEGEEERQKERQKKEAPTFQLDKPHAYGEKLAVYYCNRAAALLQLAAEGGEQDAHLKQAIDDCSVAVLLRPAYVKAWLRRATAYERLDNTEAALQDAKTALQMEPGNASIQKTVRRLQKLEDERLEQLKTETIEKLKDLGNSILGNFGLSLDNFNAVQDPNTGSYSISFNQGQGGNKS
jgi:tetratricopeptide (TPR) repeat protein